MIDMSIDYGRSEELIGRYLAGPSTTNVGTSSADHLRSNLAIAAQGRLPADVYEEARRRLVRP